MCDLHLPVVLFPCLLLWHVGDRPLLPIGFSAESCVHYPSVWSCTLDGLALVVGSGLLAAKNPLALVASWGVAMCCARGWARSLFFGSLACCGNSMGALVLFGLLLTRKIGRRGRPWLSLGSCIRVLPAVVWMVF